MLSLPAAALLAASMCAVSCCLLVLSKLLFCARGCGTAGDACIWFCLAARMGFKRPRGVVLAPVAMNVQGTQRWWTPRRVCQKNKREALPSGERLPRAARWQPLSKRSMFQGQRCRIVFQALCVDRPTARPYTIPRESSGDSAQHARPG